MTSDDFKLTPQTDQVNSDFASELLATIQLVEQTNIRKRPVLIAWTSRMPVGIHRQLKKAAKKHNISMTSIQIEALRRVLPALLTGPELAPADDEE